MNGYNLNQLAQNLKTTAPMPVLFLGHGSPMNAIEENEFVAGFRKIALEIPKPKAILCISAHWETRGTFVTAMNFPKTIHDFGGFPQALFDVQYPAPGSPETALEVQKTISSTPVGLTEDWGLDHGAWSVIKHLYPAADVPVLELSIDYTQSGKYHYNLGKELSTLRNKGVLIIGSGNIVHNLRRVAWDKMALNENYGYDWALEANDTMVNHILNHKHESLINFKSQGTAFDLAIPTPEHYLPLLYTLGLQTDKDKATIFNNKAVGGSLTMTSIKLENH